MGWYNFVVTRRYIDELAQMTELKSQNDNKINKMETFQINNNKLLYVFDSSRRIQFKL